MKNILPYVFRGISFSLILSLSILSNVFVFSGHAFLQERQFDFYYQDFVVSAYYSPLPNQKRYLRGNYEAEIRLNGRGTNGADGTPVFAGMIAAPQSYAFNTKIEIPGLGIGSVHDRGGAIIEKQDYHRIDVWMGYGDIGLARALEWGMRPITGKVYFEKTHDITLSFQHISAPEPKHLPLAQSMLFNTDLRIGMVHNDVARLKSSLQSLGYFFNETQNNYFDTDLQQALIRFQVDNGVIPTSSSYGSGNFGPSTRVALEKTLNKSGEKQPSVQALIATQEQQSDILELQIRLSALGFYKGALDGKDSDVLLGAILAFQIENNIVRSQKELGAGNFGPKTRASLASVYEKHKATWSEYPQKKHTIVIGQEFERIQSSIDVIQDKQYAMTPKSAIFELRSELQ